MYIFVLPVTPKRAFGSLEIVSSLDEHTLARVAAGGVSVIRCGWGRAELLEYVGGEHGDMDVRSFQWTDVKLINNHETLDIGKRIKRAKR